MTDPRLLLLHPTDDVLVARGAVTAGELVVEGQTVFLPTTLLIGHKIARHPIAEGAQVLKYGVPIGVATAPIAAGAHVHTHNLRSDYTPTYTLESAREKAGS